MPSPLSKSKIEALIASLGALVVDDSQFMRKIVRNLLVNIGVRDVYEASDGLAGLQAIRTKVPDVVIIDWELPLLNGSEFVRIVRSPGVFPVPDIPIIMLSSHGERSRVIEDKWIRPFASVHPGDLLHDALESLQVKGAHMARVVERDGSVIGLVTLEDVLEELVGEIRDAAHHDVSGVEAY